MPFSRKRMSMYATLLLSMKIYYSPTAVRRIRVSAIIRASSTLPAFKTAGITGPACLFMLLQTDEILE